MATATSIHWQSKLVFGPSLRHRKEDEFACNSSESHNSSTSRPQNEAF